jgi:hypothetical protein
MIASVRSPRLEITFVAKKKEFSKREGGSDCNFCFFIHTNYNASLIPKKRSAPARGKLEEKIIGFNAHDVLVYSP